MAHLPHFETVADFRHVESWIFDLDNTLYPAASGLFGQIDERMTEYVSRLLNVDPSEARAIQKTYYREHGTTLNGLMNLHRVDPDAYLAFVHDIDLSSLEPDAQLKSGLSRLRGTRYIFTNGCRHHAARVLDRLDIGGLFDGVWDIRTTDFRPKHHSDAFRSVLDDGSVVPNRAAMFDDILRNLAPAHDQGMTTVWLRNDSEWSKQGPAWPAASREHVDHETADLPGFLHSIRI